jgi:tRNA U34 5-carboxymethylaminomethyl modifying enzyme MnmG/GidA
LKFDKRLFELNVRLGLIKQEDIENYQKNLVDLESQSEKLDIEKEDNDIN